MEAGLVSLVVVALAEVGDRTQLLAAMLAARFRQPVWVLAGIFVATVANHGLSAALGYYAGDLLKGPWLAALVAVSFFATAAWSLLPETAQSDPPQVRGLGVFMATAFAFFLVEIGDRTQVATISLAARFHAIAAVAAGTTLGMMAANAPAVLFGDRVMRIAPPWLLRFGAPALFAALGLWTLIAAFR